MTGESPTLRDLVKQTMDMRERLLIAQAELADTELTRSSGGGLVAVTMMGNGEVTRVTFDQAALDDCDAESLGALTLAAIGQATDAIKSLATEKITAVSTSIEADARASGY